MRKFQCLLFVLKRSYICYYIICMTVPLRSEQRPCKSVKILTSEQIACAVILYFGQVFVFCRSVNKNVLEWFQLVISKIYALTRSTNLLSRNHSILCFFFFFHDHSRITGLQRKREGISLAPQYDFNRFTDTYTLAGRLLQRAYLCTQIAAGLEPGTLASERKSLATKKRLADT